MARLLFIVSLILMLTTSCVQKPQIHCTGGKESDLTELLEKEGFDVRFYNSKEELIENVAVGASVMLLCDTYPEKGLELTTKEKEQIQKKDLNVFCEYLIPETSLADSSKIKLVNLERIVIVNDTLGENLQKNTLLAFHRCYFQPYEVENPLMVFAKVAGFDTAVYGLENTETYPFLFTDPGNKKILISTTKISHFAQARYVPEYKVKALFEFILNQITNSKEKIKLNSWVTHITPAYSENESLPANARKESIIKGCEWFYNGNLIVDKSWKKDWIDKYIGDGSMPVGPQVDLSLPDGDGSFGVLEGHMSDIDCKGNQSYRFWMRDDVQGESAYAMSVGAKFTDNGKLRNVAENLIDYSFREYRDSCRNNPESPSFGLLGWASTHKGTYYGDDNARSILGTMGSAALLDENKWNRKIAECIIGNFRTTGKNGFRSGVLYEKDIQAKGWRAFYQDTIINPHPHFEAWNWACYLWLYDKTGYKPLLERSKRAIKITMDSYPQKWNWTNGIQQERARMILPLAWLARVDSSKEATDWLNFMVDELLKNQAACGGIREELGDASTGMFGCTRSNEEYGKHEAPLIFNNGDPICDMLYTTNFAFVSLNEAAKITNNPKHIEALYKMSDFLTRIQVRSERFKSVDGAWFRAFNYQNWDYWASNADAGWGAWSTLTGWIQSWIVGTQGLVEWNTSLWDITKTLKIQDDADKVIHSMLEEPFDK